MDRLITAPILIDEVERLGGRIVLLLYVDRAAEVEIELPQASEWLVDEIRLRKPEVIVELKQRYLTCAVLSELVQ